MKNKAITLIILGSIILISCGNEKENKTEKSNNSTKVVSK